MPHYFLNVRNATISVDDEEGENFRDLEAARARAVVSIRAILGDEVTRGKLDLRGRIEIADASGQIVSTLPYAKRSPSAAANSPR
jgi:hypothetical protein